MSVLIKGMEMPEYKGNGTIPDLHKAVFKVYSDGSVDLVLMEGKEHFQITEVPTPHGRLIDADRCLSEVDRVTYIDNYDYDSIHELVHDRVDAVETIIEAEK